MSGEVVASRQGRPHTDTHTHTIHSPDRMSIEIIQFNANEMRWRFQSVAFTFGMNNLEENDVRKLFNLCGELQAIARS